MGILSSRTIAILRSVVSGGDWVGNGGKLASLETEGPFALGLGKELEDGSGGRATM